MAARGPSHLLHPLKRHLKRSARAPRYYHMIVRSPKQTWPYVLFADRRLPREQQTVWKLKHLTLAEEQALLDNWSRDPITGQAVRNAIGSEHLTVLRRGLVGWTNLLDADGLAIPFEAGPWGGATDDLLFRIPLMDREELARAIENEVVFEPEEVGKSSPPSA